jgi:hypothetical protein
LAVADLDGLGQAGAGQSLVTTTQNCQEIVTLLHFKLLLDPM